MKNKSEKVIEDSALMKLENSFTNIEDICNLLHLLPVAEDFITSMCGDKLGAGCYRSVYDFQLNPKFVIKVEPLNTHCNVTEHMLWNEIKGLTGPLAWVKEWFAPVEWISPNGRILCMRKTKQNPSRKRPDKIPKFMWDVKPDNFGWIGNKFVCHDYGQFYNFIHYSKTFVDVGDRW